MKTPCINVCQMDPVRGVCIGCCRTLDEIGRWAGMSDRDRDAVLAEIPRRRMRLEVPEVSVPPLA